MTLPADLLKQANELARHEPGKPRQASVRRAVSAAYYALFHQLCEEVTRVVKPRSLAALVRRIPQHGEMKALCTNYLNQRPGYSAKAPSADLIVVLKAFTELQDAQHKADYDLSVPWRRTEALDAVAKADEAFRSWKRIRKSEEATVFLFGLLFHSRSKR
jgi:uncharacterized protein (UPF0332 family)